MVEQRAPAVVGLTGQELKAATGDLEPRLARLEAQRRQLCGRTLRIGHPEHHAIEVVVLALGGGQAERQPLGAVEMHLVAVALELDRQAPGRLVEVAYAQHHPLERAR